MTDRELMQQALYYLDDGCGKYSDDYRKLIEAIRDRLAQLEPYAAQAAMVAGQTQGRMYVDPVTGDVGIGNPNQVTLDTSGATGFSLTPIVSDSNTRLAQPEQKPVAWYYAGNDVEPNSVALDAGLDAAQKANCIPLYAVPPKIFCGCGDQIMPDDGAECGNCVTARNAGKPEQEPVGWFMEGTFEDGTPSFTQVCETDPEFYVPLYTAPPQREWQGLTDELRKQVEELTDLFHLQSQRAMDYAGMAMRKREWVGLEEAEIEELKHVIDWAAGWSYENFARAIEAKLKEKNT